MKKKKSFAISLLLLGESSWYHFVTLYVTILFLVHFLIKTKNKILET